MSATLKQNSKVRQKGMTSLVISIVLLFGISFISLFSTKSIILEKKISANIYRSEQAFFIAEGANNYISSLLDSSYINSTAIRKEQKLDNASANTFNNHLDQLSKLTTLAIDAEYAQIQVQALSDDKSTRRTLSQLIAAVPIAGNTTGKVVSYPLISRLGQGYTENMMISNAYSSANIWSGAQVQMAPSSKTYISSSLAINDQDISDVILSSSGNNKGVDIIEKDFRLRQLSKDAFFENFLNEKADFIKRLASDNQGYFSANNMADSDNKHGLIWLADGEQQITLENVQIGTMETPVIMVVDATNQVFTSRGEVSIYGLLYIRGDWHPTGDMTVYGAVIVEGKILASDDPDLVKTTLYYQPQVLNLTNPLPATTARVIGSWKDY